MTTIPYPSPNAAAQLLRAYLDCFLVNDMERLATLFAPDAVVRFPYAPEGFPSRLEGRAAIADYYGKTPELVRFSDYPEVVIHPLSDDSLRVVAEFRCEGTAVRSGAPYRQTYVGLLRAADESHIADYVEFYNPLVFLRALEAPESNQ